MPDRSSEMRAVVYAGEGKVRVDDVPQPTLKDPTDAIVKVTHTSICGSDLHLLTGKTPGMNEGSVIGHEFVGTVHESGSDAQGPEPGRRVLGSFLIACGTCAFCGERRFNLCTNRRALGLGTLTGDLNGAQAEYVRVPNAALNLRSLDDGSTSLSDEDVLFAGDILTTGFYAAHLAEIEPGQTVVVVGAGPVGLCAAAAARARDAHVIVLDADAHRVGFARERMGFDAVDVVSQDAFSVVAARTNGALAHAAVDAVGAIPAVKSAIKCVRDGGRVIVVGVYGTERLDLAMGRVWIRGLDLRFSGMGNIQAHWDAALQAVAERRIDPTALITHRLSLDRAEEGYELFASREAMKVVLTP